MTDSCTYCDERVQTTDVVIAGSFAGEIAAAMALRRGARAFLGNAAGIGRDGAGVSGLVLAQGLGAPAAALSEQLARAGDGPVELRAWRDRTHERVGGGSWVQEGMPCAEAARRLLKTPPGMIGRGAASVDTQGAIVYEGPEGTVTARLRCPLPYAAHTLDTSSVPGPTPRR